MVSLGKIRVGKIEEFSSGVGRNGELIVVISRRVVETDSDHRLLAIVPNVDQLDAVLHPAIRTISA